MGRGIIGKKVLKGWGAVSNPVGRFEKAGRVVFHDGWYVEEESNSVATTLSPDHAKGVITHNDSPDISLDQSISPYRGCSHGCVRPACVCVQADNARVEYGPLSAR